MQKGRFWHEHGPYCKEANCRMRVCQGCNYHSTADDLGHDRPHCPHSKHKDFVQAPKYFHEVWPGRKNAICPSPNQPKSTRDRHATGNSVSSSRSKRSGDDPKSKSQQGDE
jgi:hypothetical protein